MATIVEQSAQNCEELLADALGSATECNAQIDSENPSSVAPENSLASAQTTDGIDLVHQDEVKPLSKNAQKKLLKLERYKALKVQRKAFEKTRRHEDTARKRKEWVVKLSSLSSEEVEKALIAQKEKRNARHVKSINRKNRLRQAMEDGQNLVIDLEFCDCMKSNELASLVQQVMYAYSANAKAAVPARLSLTGCTGEIFDHLQKLSGFENWLLHKEEKSYLEVFDNRKQDLVYLTADSNCVLEELDSSKIYIIGGIVDRNRNKGLTMGKAKSQGISTARLPINEHMKLTSSAVLTVNQVVETFLGFLDTKSWERALQRAIPSRKRVGDDVQNQVDDMPAKISHHHEGPCKDSGPDSTYNLEEAIHVNKMSGEDFYHQMDDLSAEAHDDDGGPVNNCSTYSSDDV